jgi:hypothetical protein
MVDDADLIINDIADELYQQTGRLVVEVTSAHPLTDEARQQLTDYLQETTGATTVELHEMTDESLIGGLVAMATDLSVHELSKELQDAINGLREEQGLEESGVVTRVGDGVAWIYGLRSAGYNEVLEIEATDGGQVTAFALNLLEDEIGAVVLGDDSRISAGTRVRLTGRLLDVPVGPEMVGRVVNPLGEPLDGKGPIKAKGARSHRTRRPGVMARKSSMNR